MSQLHMDHDHSHHDHFDDTSAGWHDSSNFDPHHQSPVQNYAGFTDFGAPIHGMPMSTMYSSAMHPPHPPQPTPRTTHQQLQPLIMPQMTQWPSQLTSQSTYQPSLYPSSGPVPITPASATPVSATSTHSRASATPRKTLTDADRKRMCQYHEDNPTVKQTEIGALFGVERSTVSKVLRQKEKYLFQDDGSRSPVKRSKGKFPDIDRALANWARNHQKQGLRLTDEMIREKARFFAQTVGSSEGHLKLNSSSWLEKFKQKNHLMGAKSRKGSIAEESEGTSNPPSNVQTPGAISPASPGEGLSPSTTALTTKKSEEHLKTESPDFDFSNHRRPFHSQSNTSLSSVFTDAAASSFSTGPTSPTSLSSPFFTPDSACVPNSFMGRRPLAGQPGSDDFQRPRSNTFPVLVVSQQMQYMSPPGSSDALTPKYISTSALDSPMAEMPASLPAIDETMSLSPGQVTHSMQPPPVPTAVSGLMEDKGSSAESSPVTPSQEEAARCLEVVMSYFQQSRPGLEPQEYMTIGKLMEKLKVKASNENLPSAVRRASESDFSSPKIESVDILH